MRDPFRVQVPACTSANTNVRNIVLWGGVTLDDKATGENKVCRLHNSYACTTFHRRFMVSLIDVATVVVGSLSLRSLALS